MPGEKPGILSHIKRHSWKWENFGYIELSWKDLGRKEDLSLEKDNGHMDESESVDIQQLEVFQFFLKSYLALRIAKLNCSEYILYRYSGKSLIGKVDIRNRPKRNNSYLF